MIRLCVELVPLDGPLAVERTDLAPGFTALVDDKLLRHYRITFEIGRVKNKNKNPVAEKEIRELEVELLRKDPLGGAVTTLTLTVATAQLNAHIHSRGLSTRELLMHRDQFSNQQIPLADRSMILEQHKQRVDNEPHSERSKARRMHILSKTHIVVGDLVSIYGYRNKSRARNNYLMVSVDGVWCSIRTCV